MHTAETKARALALLLTGDSPRYVAQQTGIDARTVRRWRDAELPRLLRGLRVNTAPFSFARKPVIGHAAPKKTRRRADGDRG